MSGFDIGGIPGLNPTQLVGQLRDAIGDLGEGSGPGGIGRTSEGDGITQTPGGDGKDSGNFGAVLGDALAEVGRLRSETREKADAIARGEPVELHELMIAMGKSDVAFNLMLEVRNKMVEAWQQLTRSVI